MTTTEETSAPPEGQPEQLATKRDLDNAVTHLCGEFAALRSDTRQDIRDLRQEMKDHRVETTKAIDALRQDTTKAIDALRTEMRQEMRDQRVETTKAIDALRQDTTKAIDALRTEMAKAESRTFARLSAVIGVFAVVIVLVQFLAN